MLTLLRYFYYNTAFHCSKERVEIVDRFCYIGTKIRNGR